MFTGLVEALGHLREKSRRGSLVRARFEAPMHPLELGESIAVDGVCLTVDRIVAGGFEADVSEETLARTTLGALAAGSNVHLERATPVGGRLGGHMVLGHVDGIGAVSAVTPVGETRRLSVRASRDLAAFVAEKGSIAVSGVSLTVNQVRDGEGEVVFDVMLVPHTLGRTKLLDLSVGSAVNLEVDVLARYVLRALRVGASAPAGSPHHVDSSDDERLLQKLRAGGYV